MSTIKTFIVTNIWILLVLVVVAVGLYQFVDPAPPKKLTIATGHENGRYFQLAKQLQVDLLKQGIELEILPTAGSSENLRLLTAEQGEVSIALVQSGLEESLPDLLDSVHSLGSLYYEPIWLFFREGHNPSLLTDLNGKRIAIGQDGSGTQVVAQHLLRENGVSDGVEGTQFRALDIEASVSQLASGEIDAAFFTISPNSEAILRLLAIPGVDFVDFKRSAAYTARYPYLSAVTISEGLLDLERNVPQVSRITLASTATLVVNDRFHPALTPVVLESLSQRLRNGGVLEKPKAFPSGNNTGFSLTSEAAHYYEYGPPFLLRYFPFWVASLVDRLVILIIPFLFVLIPLSKLAGPIYRWRIRSKIYRWYRYLLDIDRKIAEGQLKNPEQEQQRLANMANELAEVEVPLSYADELYHLKQHLEYIARRVKSHE